MTDPTVQNVEKSVEEHAQVKGRAEYAAEAAAYRNPEDVESEIFERQAKAQQH